MSFAEFIHMGGYGSFVWSAYGFVFVVLAINVYAAVRRLRQAQKRGTKMDSEQHRRNGR